MKCGLGIEMNRILIRCDASFSIGSGHVMRCRTLARELQRRGASITFLCRQQPGDLIPLLKQEFEVLSLPRQALACSEDLRGRSLYEAWLGCSQGEDADQCMTLVSKAKINSIAWLVVDHYGIDAIWEDRLLTCLAGSQPPRLLVIDDLADRPHRADLLLDQNFFGDTAEQRYPSLIPPDCRQLLGPHYALLGPEYSQLHPLVPQRSELRRVLVFFGGVDHLNLTSCALEALSLPQLEHLAVDVVLGQQSPHRHTVAEWAHHRPSTTLHSVLPSLAGLIARADVGIGAGGSTTWERACLGLPSLAVAMADNQRPSLQWLERAGHLTMIGTASSLTCQQIGRPLLARSAGEFPAAAGHGLTDGWGSARLATAMLGQFGSIRLRQAAAADEDLLLRWANDPQVRANSFSPEPIAPEEHSRWFRASLANPHRIMLIACDALGCPLGQIRFDRKPVSDSEMDEGVVISFSLDRAARGHGLGPQLLRHGLKAIQQCWGEAVELVAEVLSSNQASHSCFMRAGFSPDPSGKRESFQRWRWRS